VVQAHLGAIKLDGDNAPAAAENLKLFLILNADTDFEALGW
jgi:hypothetical protein